MAKLSEGLMSSMKGMFGGVSTKQTAPEKPKDLGSTHLKIAAKNFLALNSMARDLNVASQNIKELVRVMGGKPRDKEDMHMLKDSELEEKLKVETEKEKATITPTPIKKEKKAPTERIKKIGKKVAKKGVDLKKQFSENEFLKAFAKYFAISAIVGVIFVAFKDTLAEWVNNLWESIKEKFDEWVANIKRWFEEVVQPIIDNVKQFIDDMITKVGDFFGKIGDWFVEKINFIKDGFESASGFVKNIWNKFMGMIDDFKAFLKPKIEGLLQYKATAWMVPEFVKKWLRVEAKEKETTPPKTTAAPAPAPKVSEPAPTPAPTAEPVRTGAGGILVTEEGKAVTTAAPLPAPTPAPTPAPVPKVPAPPPVVKPVVPAPTPKVAPPAPSPAPTPTPKITPVPSGPPAEAIKKPPEKAPTPAAKPPSPSETKPQKLSAEAGKKAMLKAMDDKKITDPTMRAAIMAQVGHESGNFTMLSENLNYKAPTLLKLFPKKFASPDDAQQVASGGPVKVAERLYGGRMGNAPEGGGEGFKFRGRGFIQLTGKQNYTKFGYANDPEAVAQPEAAADSALKYMVQYKGDWNDIKAVTKFVNGGYIGLEDRQKHFQEYLNDPKITQVGAATTAASGSAVSTSSTQVAADQRQQQKPSTPIVVNAPVTNNQVVKKTQVASSAPQDSSRTLVARAA